MSQMNMTKIAASQPLRLRYFRTTFAAMRRALEQSVLYSEELGIDLAQRARTRRTSTGSWRAFCSVPEFRQATAKKTFRAFMRHGLTTPKKIVAAGWDFLVWHPVMREGGYVRDDGRKSTQVLRDC